MKMPFHFKKGNFNVNLDIFCSNLTTLINETFTLLHEIFFLLDKLIYDSEFEFSVLYSVSIMVFFKDNMC